ncbi:hypothetical protein MNBD_PLANCTO03-780, partial [hydrothermal vent metagenome]
PTTPADAVCALRAAAEGHLTIDEQPPRRVRYVFDRRRGGLVFPMPAEAAGAGEGQLLVPDEHDPVVAALLSLDIVTELDGAVEIRFEIYHGRAHEAAWAIATIEALRYHGEPFDSEELVLTDEILEHEPGLCRELNTDPEALRAACANLAGAEVEEPVAVGVDPDGIDIRARFGIVRLGFVERAETIERVREQIAALTARSRA